MISLVSISEKLKYQESLCSYRGWFALTSLETSKTDYDEAQILRLYCFLQVILKPALGSFCTLDPLGYDYKQMDVMFMTLGSMIGQLRKGSAGEHQLRLLFALLRTCAGRSIFNTMKCLAAYHGIASL